MLENLRSKRVTVLGKSIPAMAIALVLIGGLASAGLLSYYGRITTTVTVEQSVKLDGKSCPECEITDAVVAVAGSQVHGGEHYLTNANTEVDAIVSLDSVCIAYPGDNCDGLTIAPKFRLDAVKDQDNDDLFVIPPTTIWSDFDSVSFEYLITDDSVYTNTPHVNIALRDEEGNAQCLLVSNEISTTKDEWKTATFDKFAMESGSKIEMGGTGSCDSLDGLKFNSITIEVADGWDVIKEGQEQTVWVKNPKITADSTTTLMNWFRVPHPYTGDNVPARTVYFKMGFDFDIAAQAGTYTIITTVVPHGTYTQGFTWSP